MPPSANSLITHRRKLGLLFSLTSLSVSATLCSTGKSLPKLVHIASMSERQCRHPDIRKFAGLRCCLACGKAVFETSTPTEANNSQSTTQTTYKYTNLNYKLGQETRLIVLYPGEPADELHCEIIHVNLDDEPDYEAVSYTWASDDGDASLSRTIYCGNSACIPITTSCDAALRQLRKRGLRRWLWIDAVSTD